MYQENEIKERFVIFCKRHKITQAKIADAIGASQGGIHRWWDLSVGTMPHLTAIHYLVSEYGLDFDWLMTGKTKAKP